MADEKSIVRCPACGGYVMKGSFEGTVETYCGNKRCHATLEITMKSGTLTVTVLATKEA